MPKVNVDITLATHEEVAAVLADFGITGLQKFRKCYGGFSGSNYACTVADGAQVLLKCTNDQPRGDVESQVAALLFLKRAKAPTCFPRSLANGSSGEAASDYVSMRQGNSPSIVLDFLEGSPADKVMVGGDLAVQERVVNGAGAALAGLHAVPMPDEAEITAAGLRDAGGPGRYPGKDSGAACFVGLQEQFKVDFAADDSVVKGHPFTTLHAEQVPALAAAMQVDVPRGLIHGDPFLDNLLAKDSGEVVGWVDWEDVAVGPLMFDVGCSLIGCCYRSAEGEDNQLDLDRLKWFLNGYISVRPLSAEEKAVVVPFMRLTLLCNATWRFRNFNIMHPEVEEAKDAYKELADRIVALKDEALVLQIETIVASL